MEGAGIRRVTVMALTPVNLPEEDCQLDSGLSMVNYFIDVIK